MTPGSTMDVDGSTLTGIIAVGDVFTLAGETGSPNHTVTGGPFYVVAGASVTAVTFTPTAATGGAANDAAITITSNSAAEIAAWSLLAEIEMIDDTVKGDLARTFVGGLAKWSGSASALLDYGDSIQKSLLDEIASGTPDGTIAALQFQVGSGKTWYGAGELLRFVVQSQEGSALALVSFDFQGSGQVLPDWN